MDNQRSRLSQDDLLGAVGRAVALEQERIQQIDPSLLGQVSGGTPSESYGSGMPTGTTAGYFPTSDDQVPTGTTVSW